MTAWPTERIRGAESFLLRSRYVQLAITAQGAHMAPVTFFPQDPDPIQPYAIAPWADEPLPADTAGLIATLRGDFFCSAFGANQEEVRGRDLPLHGETANGLWHPIRRRETVGGAWMQLGIDLPLQGGRCVATTAVLNDHSVIYQRHDLKGLTGPLNPGHHATLAFADREGAGRLSFSALKYAQTYFEPTESAKTRGRSCLRPNAVITDLRTVPCVDGSVTDLTRYPARRGFEDVVLLCTDPCIGFGWSAVAFPEERYVWFALRHPQQLTCTLLWFSNGGRDYPPWNGRHTNVLGVEDMTGFFQVGLAQSCRPNVLTVQGVRTCLEPDVSGRISIPYIQGLVRVPEGFDQVARIEDYVRSIRLTSTTGVEVVVPCETDFLRNGKLPPLELPDP